MGRINIIVCDGFGVGEAPDANEYGDVGSNTFKGFIYMLKRREFINQSKIHRRWK